MTNITLCVTIEVYTGIIVHSIGAAYSDTTFRDVLTISYVQY